jgi:hypothetical protein
MPTLSFRKYKPITPGTYLFEVESIAESKGKYGETLQWKCKIIDESEEAGNFVNYLTSAEFGPKSKTFKFVLKLGCSEEDFVEDSDFEASDLKGAQFYASVETTESDGKQYSNLKDIWSIAEMEQLLANLSGKKKLVVPAKTADTPAVTTGKSVATVAGKAVNKTVPAPAPVQTEQESEAEGEAEQESEQVQEQQVEEAPLTTVAADKQAPVRRINPLLKKAGVASTASGGVPAGDFTFPKGKK